LKIEKTQIEDLFIIYPDFFPDERGYFFESYNARKFEDAGLNLNFVQDNISKSQKGTIRGLHYQVGDFAQGKLCQVIYGKVLDVAVDLRYGSPTYGKHHSIILEEGSGTQFYLSPGFAHGFAVLSDEAIFHYKCTAFYSEVNERSIIYNDPDLNIDWQIENPIISDKDKNGVRFSEIEKDFIY